MPLPFPSHQGLLAPLWRLCPGRFPVLALWVGALVPDAIDGVLSPIQRGSLGQSAGHSLLVATLVGVPVGLLLTTAARRLARRPSGAHGEELGQRGLRRTATWLRRVDESDRRLEPGPRLRADAVAVWLGAWSHLLVDLLSHERSRLFWPFADDPVLFGPWWRTVWCRVSIPCYPDYAIGPHFVAWLVFSAAGAVMFFRWPPRTD